MVVSNCGFADRYAGSISHQTWSHSIAKSASVSLNEACVGFDVLSFNVRATRLECLHDD